MSTGGFTTPKKDHSLSASEYFNLVCHFEIISPLRTIEEENKEKEKQDVGTIDVDGDKKQGAKDNTEEKEVVEVEPPGPAALEPDWYLAAASNTISETPTSLATQQPEVVERKIDAATKQVSMVAMTPSTWKDEGKEEREALSLIDEVEQVEEMVAHLRPTGDNKAFPLLCDSCLLTNAKYCEWDQGVGVHMRMYGYRMKHKYKMKPWEIRYRLYRFYNGRMHGGVPLRLPLPWCVELEVKKLYPGNPHKNKGYTGFKYGTKKKMAGKKEE
jgi:hypothetical protein